MKYEVHGYMEMGWVVTVDADSEDEAIDIGCERAFDGDAEFTEPVDKPDDCMVTAKLLKGGE